MSVKGIVEGSGIDVPAEILEKLMDIFEDILKNKEATAFVAKIMDVMIESKTDVSEDISDEEKLMMVRSLTVETIVDFLARKLPSDSKFIINHTLNKIKK